VNESVLYIARGWEVETADGRLLGTITRVYPDRIEVYSPLFGRAVELPATLISAVANDRVYLASPLHELADDLASAEESGGTD
jgi:hypothetical protein